MDVSVKHKHSKVLKWCLSRGISNVRLSCNILKWRLFNTQISPRSHNIGIIKSSLTVFFLFFITPLILYCLYVALSTDHKPIIFKRIPYWLMNDWPLPRHRPTIDFSPTTDLSMTDHLSLIINNELIIDHELITDSSLTDHFSLTDLWSDSSQTYNWLINH